MRKTDLLNLMHGFTLKCVTILDRLTA